ncbi:MAG TPA: histidine phosphatase family protein, partial [Pirellulales bacterium]
MSSSAESFNAVYPALGAADLSLSAGISSSNDSGLRITARSPKRSGFKEHVVQAVWDVMDRLQGVLSATFTGSFLLGDELHGISDIDLVVIVDRLNATRYDEIRLACETALKPIVQQAGFDLQINSALGPLKFNDPKTAVLHLMLYDRAAHVEHVINSPFTCFDWQRSSVFRKQAMADVYPVFALQPHHFVSTRRGAREYLQDYRAGVMSYRELRCDANGYREERCQRPMTVRCRHEFAYHIVRFLMQNLLKLAGRHNEPTDGEELARAYAKIFPLDGDDVSRLYAELSAKKKSTDFAWPIPNLDRRLEWFVANFESQFRRMFYDEATRHVVFRHAPTAMNGGSGEQRRFVGRSTPDILPVDEAHLEPLLRVVSAESFGQAFVSPLGRCQQTYDLLRQRVVLPEAIIDNRLLEIDYGQCEAKTVELARRGFPDLFAAWRSGEDPAFPGGEGTEDVAERATAFVNDYWPVADAATIACT